MYRVESRFVIGSSNILSAAVYVCTFQPGNVKAFFFLPSHEQVKGFLSKCTELKVGLL